ncbi:hypothetical protein Tsubulata_017251 [Turnera subulata]|uniref:S-protein homolog n=1 Tax=Turnera subulata TaxID=218843 RepID=A0A9Q0EYU7_9ROSI|nr:hypothetical protein Tsubulata_017251 [Turnera subulata]
MKFLVFSMSNLNFQSYIIILVLLTLALCNSGVVAGPKYHVQVFSGLSNNNNLEIHCRSKDDDLGRHELPWSAEFTWSFRMDILGTTVFWCDMNWANGHGSFNVFWNDGGFLHKCNYKNCIWVAQDDGLYLDDIPASKYDLMYTWEK